MVARGYENRKEEVGAVGSLVFLFIAVFFITSSLSIPRAPHNSFHPLAFRYTHHAQVLFGSFALRVSTAQALEKKKKLSKPTLQP